MSIWLIGTGPMAVDYAKVLQALGKEFITIGRSAERAAVFETATGAKAISGGLEKFLANKPPIPDFVVNSTGIDKLSETTMALLDFGCGNILVEKPAVGYPSEIYAQAELATKKKARVLLAYNRRFYQSVVAAQKIITEDGGVRSFNFEFTEWSHQIANLVPTKTQAELQNWFLGNSTHVIDLAFFLGGDPAEISTYVTGKGRIDWHKNSAVFAGAGRTHSDALFSYQANWCAPGRFSVEILTDKRRLIFRPLEKLQVQLLGSVQINMAEGINYELDEKFKPGLYLQTQAFLEGNDFSFCSLEHQKNRMQTFCQIGGYSL
jgi:predicted dehydrogenase